MTDPAHREEALDRLSRARAFVFDIDGTLVLGDEKNCGFRPLPGATELLSHLAEAHIPYVAFTNGTLRTPKATAEMLRDAGLLIADTAVLTPSAVAAGYLGRQKYKRILVLGCEGVWRPLADAGLDVVLPGQLEGPVDAVYVGWYREFTMDDLEAACRCVLDGAKVFTSSNVPFFATAKGRAFGTSFAISAMIKALTGVEARVLGKPSIEALAFAASLLNVERAEIAVVGDDPLLEVQMALEGGALAVAVTTGLTDEAAFLGLGADSRPDLIFRGVGDILDHLGS
ncbi:MAG: HAD family hydrolase [Sphingomonadales bacterium]